MRYFHWITLISISILVTIGCASKPSTQPAATKAKIAITSQDDINESQAEALIANGQLADAALVYNKLADTKASPEKENLKFEAVRLMIKSGNAEKAASILTGMDIGMEHPFYPELVLLDAKILIAKRDAVLALARLSEVEEQIPQNLKVEYLQTHIEALKLDENYLLAGEQQVLLHKLIETEEQRHINEQAILDNFTLVERKKLQAELKKTSDPELKGWLELALVVTKTRDPLRLTALVDNWKRKYVTHPASPELLASLAPPSDNRPPDLSNIAVLLPLEGAFANAAKAIRDGMLSAYYQQKTDQAKPTIRIYDTSGDTPVGEVYQHAINDGATIVVGPLDKKKIIELTSSTQLTVPTLALNHVENEDFYVENLFQFGLSPEDEAQQIAQRAWYDGHNEAALIYPEGNWGERVAHAFKQRWEQLGGRIAAEEAYPAKKNDFSATINKLLNIDQSKARKKQLSKLLNARMRFEPRRRQDIDFVFMGAFPRQARLIPPQLKFFDAGDLPVYTTSHSFSGKINRSADRDMNGVIFGDMPWTILGNQSSPVRKTVYRTFPKGVRKFSRLYALGVDAHNVLYYLNWLRGNTNAKINGATGTIHMNANNRLARDLTWARFSRGSPKVLAMTPKLPSF